MVDSLIADPEMRTSLREHATELGARGELSEAAQLFRLLIASDPHDALAAKSLALVLLTQGDYRAGAELYEARLDDPRDEPGPGLPYERWRGQPLDEKRVLIWGEQGAGDQIMFSRFIPDLERRGCDVTFVCHPTLERLFRASLPGRILAARGTIEFPDPDVWLLSNSLLPALVRSDGDIPGAPYLSAPAKPAPFRIGVATRGNPKHGNDAHRSLPPDMAAELLSLPNTGSLLPEDTGATNFYETAMLMSDLDLVITVDTSIAHLAGAMGKPVWILLSDVGVDWRWQRGRQDSPWYPSATLFRQPAPGDWPSVVADVRNALLTLNS